MRTLALMAALASISCSGLSPAERPPDQPVAEWSPLWTEEDVGDWRPISYGGEGEVELRGGELHIDVGNPLTGFVFGGDLTSVLPESQDGYHLRFEAKRVTGNDFFVGATFPVGKDGRLTLILGGWGGSLAGLSSLDGMDASMNNTTQYVRFERDRWYDVEILVSATHVECRLDGKRLNRVERAVHERIWIRPEVEPSLPLGFSTFTTYGIIRNPRVRPLS